MEPSSVSGVSVGGMYFKYWRLLEAIIQDRILCLQVCFVFSWVKLNSCQRSSLFSTPRIFDALSLGDSGSQVSIYRKGLNSVSTKSCLRDICGQMKFSHLCIHFRGECQQQWPQALASATFLWGFFFFGR